MKSVLITGANRGIGLEFVKYYIRNKWNIYATYRSEHQELLDLTTRYEHLTLLKVDVSDPQSITKLQQSMTGISLNLLINNAGIYGPHGHQLGQTDASMVTQWQNVFTVNSIAPMLVCEALLKNLHFGHPSKIAFITSKMGSIDDNSSGGSVIYRSSKTALNSIAKCLSIELKDQDIGVVLLHPGWVQTDMGGENALIDTTTSVNGMAEVIEQLSIDDSGCFLSYDGQTVPW